MSTVKPSNDVSLGIVKMANEIAKMMKIAGLPTDVYLERALKVNASANATLIA